MNLEELLQKVTPADESARRAAIRRWDAIAKPLRSLGVLEEAVAQMAAIKGTADVIIGKTAVIIMCADNGVVAEGVSQAEQEVTAIVAENMTKMATSVCRMAQAAGTDVFPVDIGVYRPLCDGVIDLCVRRGGTRNMVHEPAMTKDECTRAILSGAELVLDLKTRGYDLIATGEMGIGNTTTSAAVVSALLGKTPREVTGRGAGLSTGGLERKIRAIETAIAGLKPNPKNPLDVLSKVGGLDIAGLVGVFLGGAAYRVPILVDGFISATAALLAVRICADARDYQLASHMSREPACKILIDELGMKPFIFAEMNLGEGTGAVAAIPLLKMAVAVYGGMTTFEETNIEPYTPLD